MGHREARYDLDSDPLDSSSEIVQKVRCIVICGDADVWVWSAEG